ncbi:polyketide synthase [Longimicrobium sp.]|uniref:type I polyketide synthase n=1 Tax=Longimicrobium sp. TaxID=2029185 RepID=UPI002E31570B|nr:polyketide synthase [Longimicrobium sp.]HEX6041746.1 beta-ketoacyl synthase N-terminal-like domain-containing protein [Longimicrobium sp.]
MSLQPETAHAADDNEYEGVPEVAVIGMAGRFPGADDLDAFWRNLRDGVEGIRHFTPDELRAAGIPDEAIAHPAYVPSFGSLNGIAEFDAAFFGYNPREAESMEPAHRLFLEVCWEAMENAGVDPARASGNVGVFAGAGTPYYTQENVRGNAELAAALGEFQLGVGSGKDFFATRAAYKLDLRGPAVSVQTGCSSSLVAVHMAAQSLLHGECDLALAGGANVVVPNESGYLYAPGGISSPDGHCRAFDVDAAGTLGGNGVGAVLLKRLADALRDGDRIRAVVKGSAVNNDGALKVAFTAPSVQGQAAVIREALEMADVDPSTIRFVEGHGSGTDLGDPIEIAALTQAYRGWTDRRQYAAVGSVKTNVGHLDAAAGIAGFIKTVLAVEAGEVPPTVHFRRPNPKIDFASSPFYVSAEREAWGGEGPRRAAVSSFGIGGTNAHVVIEQAPEPRPSAPRRQTQLLVLSARSPSALDAATERLAVHVAAHPDQSLADVAHTLQAGRREFPFRRAVVVRPGEDAAALLSAKHPERVWTAAVEDGHRSVAFLFPGVGDQYPQMARGLYETEPAFRAEVDRCAELLRPRIGVDIREVIFPGDAPAETPAGAGVDLRAMLRKDDAADPHAARLNRTELAQPAVFVIEYALAKLWMSWGIVPQAVIGHSLGEYAAACIAGIFSLDDALALVAERARLIGALPGGAMLAVPLGADEAAKFLVESTAIATVNAPALCVVAGPADAVEAVRQRLADAGHVARPLAATHAFHSPMMDPAVGEIGALVGRMRLNPPRIPMASNVTGTWITADEATDARYWARHTRETVRFDRGIAEALRAPGRVLVEVGPGQTLSTFVRQRGDTGDVPVIPSIRYPYDRTPDAAFLLGALGRLWLAGVTPDWAGFHAGERLNRVPLPTYPWERQRYWVDAPRHGEVQSIARGGRRADPADWLYVPTWRRTAAPRPAFGDDRVLVFADDSPLSAGVLDGLRAHGRSTVVVRAGEAFAAEGGGFTVRPASRDDHRKLVDALAEADGVPTTIVHLWSVAEAPARGTVGVLVLADALGRDRVAADLVLVTAGAAEVDGSESVDVAKSALLGAASVLRAETPTLEPRVVDVALPASDAEARALGARIAAEALAGRDRDVALRGRHRWARGFESVRPAPTAAPVVREGGVYLFIGGLRGRNEQLAENAVRRFGARIALLDPTLPHPGGWDIVVKARLPEDPVRRQIERIRALEAAGAQVLTLQLQPSEADQMEDALRQVQAHFGALHGVVYAPLAHQEMERGGIGEVRVAPWERRLMHLLGELNGVRGALADRVLDFVVVESSLTPELGGVALIDVAALHAIVDAFASTTAGDAQPWTAAAWDRWYGEGEPREGYGMDEDEALAAFEHLLSLAGEPVVLLSTGDVEHRATTRADSPAAAIGSYARPELATEYLAPTTDIEEVVAQMWEELLGISPIGIHDDFFALGGHSLLATQIISRCRESFGLELPLKAIFEAPTIARFAALVEDAIVAEIDTLTDEQAMELAGT